MNWIIAAAGFLGFSAIALGAYGDHGLRGSIDAENLHSFESAVKYQILHAITLLAIGIGLSTTRPPPMAKKLCWAGLVMLTGTILFCATIYAKVIFGVDAATKLAPAGGMTIMAGWLMLVWVGFTQEP